MMPGSEDGRLESIPPAVSNSVPATTARMSQFILRRSKRNIRPLICQPIASHEGPCLIENLPPEIMREIFICRFDEWLIPLSLFLVNRRWNEIASGLSLLRSVIHIRRPEEYTFMSTEYDVPVFCTSSAQFGSALSRLGDGKFELCIKWMPEDIFLEDFPLRSRCRCLELGLDPSERTLPFSLPPMDILEELRLGQYLDAPIIDMDPEWESELFEQMENSATLLRILRISGRFPMSLMGRLQLLGRLKTLDIVTEDTFAAEHMESLLKGLSNATDVLWEPQFAKAVSLAATHQALKSLSLLNICELQLKGLSSLASLTLGYELSRGVIESAADPDAVLHFPLLETLYLGGRWSDLQRIRAPLLYDLYLQSPRETSAEIKAVIPRITVSPKVLAISNRISDYNLKKLLHGVWTNVEVLHLLACERHEVPSDALIRALSATSKTTIICPKLWCLTFKVLMSEQKDPETFRRCVEKLQSVSKRRGTNGLIRIRCGWDAEDQLEVVPDFKFLEFPGIWYDVL